MVVGISLHDVKLIIMVCNVYTFYSVLQQCISTDKHLLSPCLIAVIASLVILHTFQIVLVGIDRFLIFMDANERSMSLLPTNFELARSKLMQDDTLMKKIRPWLGTCRLRRGNVVCGLQPKQLLVLLLLQPS